MKRMTKLIALMGVLAVLMGATLLVQKWNPENQPEETEPAEIIFTLDADSVTALSWDYSEKVNFICEEGQWRNEDEAFPLDESYIETILETLAEVEAYKTIENADDLDQYGLEAPICAITVTADQVWNLAIGQETGLGGERYFSIGDGNVYLVDEGILDAFSYGLYDLLEYETIPEMEDVTSVTITADTQSLALEWEENSGRAYSDEYVWFLGDQALDTELTEAFVENITGLSWGECVDYSAEDLSLYGLDDPAVTATVEYLQTAQLATGETDEEGNAVYETVISAQVFVLELGDDTDEGTYARLGGSDMVYLVDASIKETLCYTTSADLLPDEVLVMDWEEVTAIDISIDGELWQITRSTETVTDDEGNESEETVWLMNGEEVAVSGITDALDSMTAAGYATGFVPERTEELRLVFHREHETFPEVTLSFYQYNSDSCLTTLNGEATVFADRAAVVALAEIINALILK